MRPICLALAILPVVAALPVTAAAQTVAPMAASPVAAPAPANLAAATAVVDLIMPAASRDQMMDQMMAAMMQGMVGAMTQSPQLQAAFEKEPRARAIFEKSLARQQAETLADVKAQMPGMLTAMSRAYARMFSLAELDDMKRFFASPTGMTYVRKAPGIMSDPDVVAWSRTMIDRAVAKAPAQAKALADEIAALPPA
jgi:hypothetical protein